MAYKHSISNEEYLDINTLENRIDNAVNAFCASRGIDLSNYKATVATKQNTMISLAIYIYKQVFKPPGPLNYNQQSLLDYENLDEFRLVALKFIEIMAHFDKSQGVYCFSLMTGIGHDTIRQWETAQEPNSQRMGILKAIKEYDAQSLKNKLIDAGGMPLAMVANHDSQKGLEYAKAQQLAPVNAVFVLPTERDRLAGLLDKQKP